jgi:hypothetical protein
MDNGTAAIIGALAGGGIAFGITAYFKVVDQAREKYILASGILIELDDHHECLTKQIYQFKNHIEEIKKTGGKIIHLSSVQDIHFPPDEPKFLIANLSNIGILGAPLIKVIIDYMDRIDVLRDVISHIISQKNSVLMYSLNVPKQYGLDGVGEMLGYVVKLKDDCKNLQKMLLNIKRYHRVLGMVWDLEN